LQSLLLQTRPPDHILVVDNASTDGTLDLLNSEFPNLEQLKLKTNTGGAGGFKAGMQYAHSSGYDWIWVMDDDIELMPECLETMLAWQHVGDVIHVRKQFPWGPLIWEGMWDPSSADLVTYKTDVSFANGRKWTTVQYSNFEGALIRRMVIDRAGLPDERYFLAGDDTMYGYIASLHSRVIYVDYVGIMKNAVVQDAPKGRILYYLSIRNRFLTYELMVKNGVQLRPRIFLLLTFICALSKMMEAARSKNQRVQNVWAAIEGLLDGLRGRFGPPPWI